MIEIQKKIIEDNAPEDVSEPRPPRKESEIIAENRALYRRMWFMEHRVYIFAAVGVLLVALIFLGVRIYHQHSNPLSRFMAAAAKDFSGSFAFEMKVSEGDTAVMQYTGTVDVDRENHAVNALYDAQYADYGYTSATFSDGKTSMSGSFYEDKWRVRDCTAKVQDFFDFDTDFRNGEFDAGAFLRFTGLTSDYSSAELGRFFDTLRERLSSSSTVAVITTTQTEEGTDYSYGVSMEELLRMISDDGAPVFYRSGDYDAFNERFEDNIRKIRSSICSFRYTIDNSGYLSAASLTVTVDGEEYSFTCALSDFGSAEVKLPDGFTEAVETAQKTQE